MTEIRVSKTLQEKFWSKIVSEVIEQAKDEAENGNSYFHFKTENVKLWMDIDELIKRVSNETNKTVYNKSDSSAFGSIAFYIKIKED